MAKYHEILPFNAETTKELPSMVRSNGASLVGERVSGTTTSFSGLILKETEDAIQVVFTFTPFSRKAKQMTWIPKSMLQVKKHTIAPVFYELIVKDVFVRKMMKPIFIKQVDDMYDLLPA